MKRTVYFLGLLMLFNIKIFGEIKNGFTSSQSDAIGTLKYLENLLHEDKLPKSKQGFSAIQKSRLKSEIRRIRKLRVWEAVTSNLLLEFQTIAPDLYKEMNGLMDSNGRTVDIYIKFLPHWKMRDSPSGVTRLSYRENDSTVYTNEYGVNSISIHISFSEIKALTLLAHELGHVKYIVPNICTYHEFYRNRFQNNEAKLKGHSHNDESSRYAQNFQNRFRSSLTRYRRKIRPSPEHLVSKHK